MVVGGGEKGEGCVVCGERGVRGCEWGFGGGECV